MKINRIIACILAGAALILGFTGCDDDKFLEERSYSFDDNTFYNTESDMEMGIASCYAKAEYLMLGQMHGNHSWMLQGIGLDTFTQTGSDGNFGDWSINAGNGYIRHWYDELFSLVNRANTVIDMIDERTAIEYSSETKKNELRGEAVFFRAWAYRNLAGMFGNVVILDHRTTEAKYDYRTNTRQEVWEFVKKEFTWAEENLPKTPRLLGTVTKAAAAHYLAEVDLALGDFQGAVDAATRVIDKTDGDYQLMTERFGNRKNEATDRYGNKLNPYWDLFRGSWGNDGSGKGKSKGTDSNANSPENKEGIWVIQYNYGTFMTGGGGDAWWRVLCNTVEANWTPGILLGNQSVRTRKSDNKTFYFYGDNVACYPAGVDAGAALSSVPGCENRQIANVAQDSLGARVTRIGTNCIPTEYVYGDLWKDDPNDFRGSETMIQRNYYTAGGTRWFDEKAAMYARAKAAVGTPDEEVYRVNAGDTTAIFPRFWKFSEDFHPDFSSNGNKGYDLDWYNIRIAETYLLRAEAYLALGNKGAAADDINVLHDRAHAKRCSADQVDIDYILDERTRELLGEEHRVITLNRLSCNPNCGSYVTSKYPTQEALTSNTAYERVHKYGFGYENKADNPRQSYTDSQGKVRHYSAFHPYNYQYPIPTEVIQSNIGAKIDQNPGY